MRFVSKVFGVLLVLVACAAVAAIPVAIIANNKFVEIEQSIKDQYKLGLRDSSATYVSQKLLVAKKRYYQRELEQFPWGAAGKAIGYPRIDIAKYDLSLKAEKQ